MRSGVGEGMAMLALRCASGCGTTGLHSRRSDSRSIYGGKTAERGEEGLCAAHWRAWMVECVMLKCCFSAVVAACRTPEAEGATNR